jgi:hypothetical protein
LASVHLHLAGLANLESGLQALDGLSAEGMESAELLLERANLERRLGMSLWARAATREGVEGDKNRAQILLDEAAEHAREAREIVVDTPQAYCTRAAALTQSALIAMELTKRGGSREALRRSVELAWPAVRAIEAFPREFATALNSYWLVQGFIARTSEGGYDCHLGQEVLEGQRRALRLNENLGRTRELYQISRNLTLSVANHAVNCLGDAGGAKAESEAHGEAALEYARQIGPEATEEVAEAKRALAEIRRILDAKLSG